MAGKRKSRDSVRLLRFDRTRQKSKGTGRSKAPHIHNMSRFVGDTAIQDKLEKNRRMIEWVRVLLSALNTFGNHFLDRTDRESQARLQNHIGCLAESHSLEGEHDCKSQELVAQITQLNRCPSRSCDGLRNLTICNLSRRHRVQPTSTRSRRQSTNA